MSPAPRLTHLCLASDKRDIGKQCRLRSDATERGVWSEYALFEVNTGISVNHGNNKLYPDIPFTGNWPIQKAH